MKSRNKFLIIEADFDEYMQACSVCMYYSSARKEKTNLIFETRQLYATEVEDYFFYFILAEEKKALNIEV